MVSFHASLSRSKEPVASAELLSKIRLILAKHEMMEFAVMKELIRALVEDSSGT